VSESRKPLITKLLSRGVETTDPPRADDEVGDGSQGILEGYASQIRPDGSQPQRTPLRADCNAETAMVLALDASMHADNARSRDGGA
jgi:hypothetical protein